VPEHSNEKLPAIGVAEHWLIDYSLVYRTGRRVLSQRALERDELSSEERRLTLALLNALREDVEQSGAEFAVMMIPSPEQVVSPATVEPDWYTLITAWCAETGTLLLEPLPVMRARQAAGERLYFLPHDPHWTQEGHQVVAGYLFDQLSDVPESVPSDSMQ